MVNPTADEVKSPESQGPQIKWQTQGLKSTYANFCNATSTREELSLIHI